MSEEMQITLTALRRIRSLEEKNVPKYAKQIATEALDRLQKSAPGLPASHRLGGHEREPVSDAALPGADTIDWKMAYRGALVEIDGWREVVENLESQIRGARGDRP